MEDVKLKYIDINEFKGKIYPYYLEIFSEKERKPFKLIQKSYEKQYTKIIEILYKNEIAGFMVINRIKDKGYVLLDYLAILPQYRNYKIGTKALKILLEQEKENSGVFIEIEKVGLGKNVEENIVREKRKNFYERIGFKKLNFEVLLSDVIYTPYLFPNIENDEDIIIDEIMNIYESILGKEKVKKNCKTIKINWLE